MEESFEVPTTSLGTNLPPFTLKSLPSLPKHGAQVGPNWYWHLDFSVPTTCEGKFQCTQYFRYAKTGSPHSQLTPACSPCSNLLQLAPLTPACSQLAPACSHLTARSQLNPACSPYSSLLPAHSSSLPSHSSLPARSSLLPCPRSLQLTPSSLQLAPSSLQLTPSSLPMAMYVLGSPPAVGCKGLWGKVGASWSKLGERAGSELEQTGVSWSELGSMLERTGEWAGSELERAVVSRVNGMLY